MPKRRKKARRARNGDGSVYQRKSDGRFVAALAERDSNGVDHRREVYARTREDAERELATMRAQRDAGVSLMDGRETVGDFLTRWARDVLPIKRRPKTVSTYRVLIDHRLIPAIGHLRLERLTPEHIDRMQKDALDDGLAPRTVSVMRAVLGAALKVAVTRGVLVRNVVSLVEGPRIEPFTPTMLTAADANRLLVAARGDRFEAGYHLALWLGMREAEILGLRWQDIDYERRQLQVRVQLERAGPPPVLAEPKTKQSRRTLPLIFDLPALLHAHAARQGAERLASGTAMPDYGLVFTRPDGGAISGQACRAAFARLLKAAGLPPMRFHDLRHAVATLLAASGSSARVSMAVLGHRNLETNQLIYTHVMDKDVTASLEELVRSIETAEESASQRKRG